MGVSSEVFNWTLLWRLDIPIKKFHDSPPKKTQKMEASPKMIDFSEKEKKTFPQAFIMALPKCKSLATPQKHLEI